jgi:predicted nucleic acid-binding protein
VTAVADASVVVTALVDGGASGEATRVALADDDLMAPSLIDIEVLHALRGRVLGGKLSARHADRAIRDLRRMPIDRLDMLPLLDRVWDLRANLSAYDAAYVALAESFEAVLITGDERLSRASGPRCTFRVVRAG